MSSNWRKNFMIWAAYMSSSNLYEDMSSPCLLTIEHSHLFLNAQILLQPIQSGKHAVCELWIACVCRHIKNGGGREQRFFHRMKTNTNKEEIFSLIDEKKLGKETKVPAEIRNVATPFYKELWKNRQGKRAYSKSKMCQMLDKIKRHVDNTTKIEGDKPITLEEVKEATKAL